MSIQKALCLICECPTADGAVTAVHVDKNKLETWFLNVCEYEIDEEIYDDDLICYFCLWHAEFQWKLEEMADENLVWWPRNSEHLDNAAKELRKKYFEGKLEQCWVQLKIIELPRSVNREERRNVQAEIRPRRWKCIYCGKRYKYSFNMYKHVKKMHKEAIRCENVNCATYFHTREEKEEHKKNVHDKQKEREKINCSFCGKEFEGPKNYKCHVRQVHKEFPVKCFRYGCLSFFRTKIEMKTHFDSIHANDNTARMFKCNDCDFKALKKYILERHMIWKHLPKHIKCTICDKMYSTESRLRMHVNLIHNFKVCTYCKLDVSINSMRVFHLHVKKCNHCKSKFPCSGLYQLHVKSCTKTQFKCDKCSKSFKFKCSLACHKRKKHNR